MHHGSIPQAMALMLIALFFLNLLFLAKSQELGDLRLDPGTGLLQVYLSGEWGEICATGFGMNEADVACHQLGFAEALSLSNGSTQTNLLLNRVECPSNDYLHLLRCVHSVGNIQCNNGSVMLTCSSTPIWNNPYPGELRLTRGAYPSEGLVEVYCNGRWGTICDDGFGKDEADTVCRQLGYTEADRYDHLSFRGSSSQPIWLDDVTCSSAKSCLRSCQQCPTSQFHNCRHFKDITIQCKFAIFHFKFGSNQTTCENDIVVGPNQGNVRLVQVEDFQDGVQSGAVEAYYNSEWRRVCDPKLSAAAVATTVCRQLGYNRFVNNTVLPYSNASRLLLSSTTAHWHILRSNSVSLTTDCDNSFAVHCDNSGTNYKGQVRLRGGQYSSEGRVEIFLENKWGTVCTNAPVFKRQTLDQLMLNAAHSVCRQLGYTGAAAYSAGTIPGSGQIWIARPYGFQSYNCFRNCYNRYSNITLCHHSQDFVVNCTYESADSSLSVGSAQACIETRPISTPYTPYTPYPPFIFTRPNERRLAGIVIGCILAVSVLIAIIAIVIVSVITRCGKKGRHGSRINTMTRAEDTVYFTPQSSPSTNTNEPEKQPLPM